MIDRFCFCPWKYTKYVATPAWTMTKVCACTFFGVCITLGFSTFRHNIVCQWKSTSYPSKCYYFSILFTGSRIHVLGFSSWPISKILRFDFKSIFLCLMQLLLYERLLNLEDWRKAIDKLLRKTTFVILNIWK